MSTVLDTLVIGAGQAGLAAGYHLQRAGVTFALLEAGTAPSGSWPHYYDSLKLFSPARFSSLPGLPFPGHPDHYPTRDEVVAYLNSYADQYKLPVVTGARVERIKRPGPHFQVITEEGRQYEVRSIIAATGAYHRPYMPVLPGQDTFTGQVLHSAAYRNPEPFKGKRIVIVGGRNSAVQIGVELAQVAHVTLATRTLLKFKAQRVFNQDIHFWWWLTGLDRLDLTLPIGYWLKVFKSGVILDAGQYQQAVVAERPDRRAMFTAFTPNGVQWADGTEEPVDAVIFATGYRPNLDYLAPLDALDESGQARQQRGISLTASGVYFVGLAAQRTYSSATVRGVGADAAHVVAHLRRYLRTQADPTQATSRVVFCLNSRLCLRLPTA